MENICGECVILQYMEVLADQGQTFATSQLVPLEIGGSRDLL